MSIVYRLTLQLTNMHNTAMFSYGSPSTYITYVYDMLQVIELKTLCLNMFLQQLEQTYLSRPMEDLGIDSIFVCSKGVKITCRKGTKICNIYYFFLSLLSSRRRTQRQILSLFLLYLPTFLQLQYYSSGLSDLHAKCCLAVAKLQQLPSKV